MVETEAASHSACLRMTVLLLQAKLRLCGVK